jgi:hypothetical protein
MTKQKDTAAALAGILSAKRGDGHPAAKAIAIHAEPEAGHPPSPAASPTPLRMKPAKAESPLPQARSGKSSDPDYRQCSIYLRKAIRKKVGRALDDADTGQDFSELVEELLEKWLASHT